MATADHVEVAGLSVHRYPAAGTAVVLVPGTMDRATSFRKVARRLPELDLTVFDRRGYAGSQRGGLAPALGDQLADLLAVVEFARGEQDPKRPLAVVGHSLGGLLALHLARHHHESIDAVGVWEPPMPWLAWYRGSAGDRVVAEDRLDAPEVAAERFMRAMVGDRVWERMPPSAQAERRADGPALLADLDLARDPAAAVEFGSIRVPAVVGSGTDSPIRFRRSAATLLAELPDAMGVEIADADHGAHLHRPDEFAAFVRATAARAAMSAEA